MDQSPQTRPPDSGDGPTEQPTNPADTGAESEPERVIHRRMDYSNVWEMGRLMIKSQRDLEERARQRGY